MTDRRDKAAIDAMTAALWAATQRAHPPVTRDEIHGIVVANWPGHVPLEVAREWAWNGWQAAESLRVYMDGQRERIDELEARLAALEREREG